MVPAPTPTRKTRPKSTHAPDLIKALAAGFLLALAALACGAEKPRPRAAARAADASAFEAGVDAEPPRLPSHDEIAAAGASAAPGMHEAARVEGTVPLERPIVRAADHDACTRAAYVASAPVDIAFVDGARAVLLEQRGVTSGVIGTACVLRGGEIGLRVSLPDAGADAEPRVRAVVWTSP
jgi:hypothetical protein